MYLMTEIVLNLSKTYLLFETEHLLLNYLLTIYKHVSLRNWRLLWFMMKILLMVPAHKRIKYINTDQTEVMTVFQQIADEIFKNQGIRSNFQSIPVPIN